jgi:superfamily II DNA or RNA helicase
MSPLLEWKLLRMFENADQRIDGPGIDMLKHAIRDMASRGDDQVSGMGVRDENDYGFTKSDFFVYQQHAHELDQPGLPVRVAVLFLNMLSKYRNTQVTHYQEISKAVTADFARARASQTAGGEQQAGGDASEDNKIIVYGNQPKVYGKVKVYVPHGVDIGDARAINKVLDAAFAAEGAQKVEDPNSRQMVYPRYLKFSKYKDDLNTVLIHPSVLNDVLEILKTRKKVEVGGVMPSTASAPGAPGEPTGTEGEPGAPQSDVEILGQRSTRYGNKLAVKFTVEYSRSPWAKFKAEGLSPNAVSYSMDDHNNNNKGVLLVNIDDVVLFKKVVDSAKKQGLNVQPLEDFAAKHFAKDQTGAEAGQSDEKGSVPAPNAADAKASDIKALTFTDLPGDAMKVKVDYLHPHLRNIQGRKDFIRECIQYSFPEYRWVKDAYYYEVKGDYHQYVSFGKVLGRFGYNVDELRNIVRAKLADNRLKKEKWVGQFDSGPEFEKFAKDIDDKLPDSTYDLYKQQKEGVAFLYGRNHAVLGDETGFGKTVQLITAAALRMKEDNKPVLIVTLKSTVQQWVDTIKSVCGEAEMRNVTTDGTNPKKWTVLYYDNFSAGKALPLVVEACKNANFGIAILDEIHKTKHDTSKRSENLASIVDNIPTVWGASATISANKPMDVHNQLKMTGHHLGKINKGKFKRDFAGMKATGYGGAYEEDEEESYKSAERLNRWLNVSGLYVRRSKDELRDMPKLNKAEIEPIKIDNSSFDKKFQEKLKSYKDPKLAVSKLIAAREVVAQEKVPATTAKVVKIVQENMDNPASNYAASKVVVFTNFVESARQLTDKIQAALQQINPRFRVITYLADTKKAERNQVKSVFTNDPNAKVLVMSMKMGGTGIDFPNASQHMVVNDFDWTPESAEQSEGRIYRINTNHPVNIDYTIANGIDHSLFKKVQRKRELAAIIQKYRKEYHSKDHDPETLQKIIDAQKEIKKLDDDMVKDIENELPATKGGKNESFRDFFNDSESLREYFFGK